MWLPSGCEFYLTPKGGHQSFMCTNHLGEHSLFSLCQNVKTPKNERASFWLPFNQELPNKKQETSGTPHVSRSKKVRSAPVAARW